MQTSDRREILDQLANGQISAAEALALLEQPNQKAATFQDLPEGENLVDDKSEMDEIDLLKSMEAGTPDPQMLKIEIDEVPEPGAKPEPFDKVVAYQSNGKKPRWLHIRVRDLGTGRNKVSINLPLGIVTFGLGIAQRFNPDMGEVDLNEMMTLIKQGESGLLVDVQDDEDNEHVQIYVD